MSGSIPNRLTCALLALGLILVFTPSVLAQDDADNIPLGDVARNLRKKPPAEQEVIDNDNLTQVMNEAESQHLSGAALLFSLDPGGKNFRVSGPDVTCSLSFNANASSLLADPISLDELPRSEVMKLDGPATIDGDTLQISVHNGTQWNLREVVIGLTIVRQHDSDARSHSGSVDIVPAAAGASDQAEQDATEKQPDVTILFHIKGSAAPMSTAVFRTPLNFELFPDQEWHWAIVRARGVPPQALATGGATQAIIASQPSSIQASLPEPQPVGPAPNPKMQVSGAPRPNFPSTPESASSPSLPQK